MTPSDAETHCSFEGCDADAVITLGVKLDLVDYCAKHARFVMESL